MPLFPGHKTATFPSSLFMKPPIDSFSIQSSRLGVWPQRSVCKKKGARVAIVGRSKKTLDEAVRTIGNGVLAVQADVSVAKDLDKLYATVSQKLGKIDILFANAGIYKFAPLAATSETLYDELFDINTRGVYFTIQKACLTSMTALRSL